MAENSNGNGANGTLASNREAIDRFLTRLRTSGNIYASCKAAGVPRTTAYRWRDKFATFRAQWDEAKEDALDILEMEAWKRAIEKDSDRLLMFLLKAHRREVYGDWVRQEVSGPGGGPVEATVRVNVGQLTDEELAALASIAGRIATDTAGEGEA